MTTKETKTKPEAKKPKATKAKKPANPEEKEKMRKRVVAAANRAAKQTKAKQDAAKRLAEETQEQKPFIPLSQDEIREIDADIMELRKVISEHKNSIVRLAKMAQTIDAYEAKYLKVLIQAHNIKNGAMEVANYFGLAEMTLETMRQDMNAIFAAKDKYMREIYEQQEAIAAQAEQAKRNREEAKRLADKRAAEKAEKAEAPAQETENNNQ